MRYKKYRYGGKKVPGMYAQDGTEVNPVPPQMQSLNERPMMNVENSSMGGLSPQQIQMMKMQALQQQQKMQQL